MMSQLHATYWQGQVLTDAKSILGHTKTATVSLGYAYNHLRTGCKNTVRISQGAKAKGLSKSGWWGAVRQAERGKASTTKTPTCDIKDWVQRLGYQLGYLYLRRAPLSSLALHFSGRQRWGLKCLWLLLATWEIMLRSEHSAPAWPHPGCCRHFGSQRVEAFSICLLFKENENKLFK